MLQKRTDILSDDEIQKAVDWLRDNADESAKCRAERIYIEEYRKSLKALLMKKFVELHVET